MGMPAVLGELSIGVVIGNFALLTGGLAGGDVFEFLQAPPEGIDSDPYQAGAVIKILAGIGVVLLLFEVGLETNIREMMSVGLSSFLVAILGVVAPMALGYAATVMVTDCDWSDWEVPAFIGATLCATSVGITARVLKDLGRAQQKESKIILGAAVIDDVLGLMVLAIVSGLIMANGSESSDSGGLGFKVVKIVGLAVGFIIGALLLGRISFTRYVFRGASYLRGHGLLVTTALVICFGFSWFANVVGLAPIVGAFAAGLILEGSHYKELGERENRSLEDALAPVAALLVPIFFVQMGLQVDLASFADPSVWLLAGAITVVAIIGKQVCALGVREPGLNRMAVGLGMIPRGEVGLIFANEGRKLIADGERVIDGGTYSAVVVMVMITTMVTPPLLKWSLNRGDPPADAK
jgi:Kef-type K+ transport system membrane component KefB